MNIALITNSFLPIVGGLEWKVHYLATEYVKRGHDVTVFASRPGVLLKPVPISVVPTYKLVRCSYSFPACGRLGIDGWLFRKAILKRHQKCSFDVLHCHPVTFPVKYAMAVKKKTGIPIVATTCGGDVQVVPEMNYGNRLDPRMDRMVRYNLKNIDVVGSISSSVRAELESMNPTARIVDIPNGVNWDEFQIGPSTLLRDRLRIAQNNLLVLSAGRNHIKKGYELGIRAFASIAGRFKNACYAIVGRGTTKLVPLVEQLGMKNQIRLVEQVPMSEMPYIYHSADIFFNPSLIEGFAQVNAQALACGLPCVITDAPGNRDAGDYGGALIAKSADIESMAEKLALVLEDSDLRQKLGKEAHAASKRYSWEKIAQQYLDIFESLVTKRSYHKFGD